jgi:hypothetical protein
MSWEALSALGSLASAVIVLVAAIAAVLQLRHLRLANQLQTYMQFATLLHSAEMSEASRFVSSQDFSDAQTLRAATTPVADPRIMMVGAHYQEVARLLNLGLLDEELFGAYFDMAPRLWKRLAPVAAVVRERSESPIWIDFEYLVYRGAQQRLLEKFFKRYPDEFANGTDVQKYRSLALSRITESPGSKP